MHVDNFTSNSHHSNVSIPRHILLKTSFALVINMFVFFIFVENFETYIYTLELHFNFFKKTCEYMYCGSVFGTEVPGSGLKTCVFN